MSKTEKEENKGLKVVTLICKQEVDTWRYGDPAGTNSTEAFRGVYKLDVPEDWNLGRPTYLAVESVHIFGIPLGTDDTNGQVPWTFEVRSHALAGEGVLEAKRWRGPISHGEGGFYNEMGDAYPYTTTEGGDEVEMSQSNLLQIIPNDKILNWNYDNQFANAYANIYDASSSGVDLNNYTSNSFYKVNWEKAVDYTSLGHKLNLNSSQSMIDVYISAGGDIGGQYHAGYLPLGEDYEHRLRLMNFPGPPEKLGPQRDNTGMNGGFWCVTLKIFRPAIN